MNQYKSTKYLKFTPNLFNYSKANDGLTKIRLFKQHGNIRYYVFLYKFTIKWNAYKIQIIKQQCYYEPI